MYKPWSETVSVTGKGATAQLRVGRPHLAQTLNTGDELFEGEGAGLVVIELVEKRNELFLRGLDSLLVQEVPHLPLAHL